MRKKYNPMPNITIDGQLYKLKSRKTNIPNFNNMSEIEKGLWLIKNTYPKGYQKTINPLMGMGDIYKV